MWGGGRHAEAARDVLSGADKLRDNRENEQATQDWASRKVKNNSMAKGARHGPLCYDRPGDVLRDNARVYRLPSCICWCDSQCLKCRKSPKRLQFGLRANFTLGSIVTNFLKPVMFLCACMEYTEIKLLRQEGVGAMALVKLVCGLRTFVTMTRLC